ncbi:MAG: sigma 54-interacting transcriptional regulator [Deltaproteobacteria bacterium]|nr:sigma 54-interacting transcriptional regulator [Deltaproteobacteria bacterium]
MTSSVPPDATPACAPGAVDQERAFSVVNAAFSSLGRICMALDADFRIRYASDLLTSLLGADAAGEVRGLSIESLLGPELFGVEGPFRQALVAGEKREGWRAVLNVANGPARLMSVSAAPLIHDKLGACDPAAAYLVVLRPADESTIEASGPIAGFGLIGRSPAMSRVFRMIDVLQHSESTVLITGESGTGKEVMARIIHAHSPRKSGPFVAVNAAALPGELLESELFGHVRGAFTGAVRDRAGRFETAEDGTLFLDEVGDVPLHLQVKLLRVLQEHTYERVGDSQMRRTNARIIAATNRNLRRLVADGRFREDLYYRLRVFPIELPPLRSRREDIEPMARLLLSRVGARTNRALHLSPEAVRVILSYEWPGNVRELENALEFAATVCQGQTLQPEDLPPEIVPSSALPSEEPAPIVRSRPVHGNASVPDRELLAALEGNRWNRVATAQALGVSRSTLWRRMRTASLT